MSLRERWRQWRATVRRPFRRPLTVGSAAYEERTRQEIEEFRDAFNEHGVERVPAVWNEIQTRAHELIRDDTGATPHGHVLQRLQPGSRMLSLGSGGGGVEMHYAYERPEAQILGLDLNPEVVAMANAAAYPNLRFETADLNRAELPSAAYDVVFAHASLHHILALEHLFAQVRRTLRSGGVFIVHDVIPPNGFLMWPETRKVVRAIFCSLPPKFRVNHAAYSRPALDREIWEQDTRIYGMECVRSGEVVAQLDHFFIRELFYPYFTLVRRFLDPMYGPNYDLDQPLDRALADYLWQLDLYYLRSGQLPGESLFAIYRSR